MKEELLSNSIEKPVIDLELTGKRIKYLRQKANLSVQDLQKILNFEYPQAIYLWEAGKTFPSMENLISLSNLFEVDILDIVVYRQV